MVHAPTSMPMMSVSTLWPRPSLAIRPIATPLAASTRGTWGGGVVVRMVVVVVRMVARMVMRMTW